MLIEIEQCREYFASYLHLSILNEPTRRFWRYCDENSYNDRNNDLEGEREPPRDRVVFDKIDSQIDPQVVTNSNKDAIGDDVRSSLMRWRDLRLPDRDHRHISTDSQTEDQSRDDKLGKIERCCHEGGADDTDKVGYENYLTSTPEVTKGCATATARGQIRYTILQYYYEAIATSTAYTYIQTEL
ncbi:hypothetical protein ACN38_g11611 [Penicillium nordicum]|uniref:Uncharacterized protein n=1 Tax=Penicillium nordicum TaxID=229535 RepID=A0A0M9WAL5_9EURO|nr:hypothetical protein ACN38_g11611 [Penicillium nordicum]